MNSNNRALISLNEREAATVAALFERMFPQDGDSPGAVEIGAVAYLDLALAGAYKEHRQTYRLGLAALDRCAEDRFSASFDACSDSEKDRIIDDLEKGRLEKFESPPQQAFFALVRAHLQEGLFSDPVYGGNQEMAGWKLLRHPGVWLENSAEENLQEEPVSKGGKYQSLADVRQQLEATAVEIEEQQKYVLRQDNRQRFSEPDILLVGLGAMGGIVAPILTKAGLRVTALEAGPWRSLSHFLPDELGHAYYCRATLGEKFSQETPRWRRNPGEPTQEATFSLGRMMNSVGGSVIHYGAWLRRFHPHHFKPLTRVVERWGKGALPEHSTLADWPIDYRDLEPYFNQLDQMIGLSGDNQNPFVPRKNPYPLPPTRDFRLGNSFKKATRSLGLHPHMTPVGYNTRPYNGLPAATYTAWDNGFGVWNGSKWHPALTCIPEAMQTGNLDLRTECRVTRLLTDRDGHIDGVEYVDANGEKHVQRSRTVILAGYTFENVRLMFLSGDGKHADGLGNNSGQLGKNFMTKMFAHVDGYFPNTIFNRHTGPAAQGVVLDDFLADEFDSMEHGFIGGATLGAENQFLPLQISREALPADVPTWGAGYKKHIRQWQNFGVVRIQPDTLPYSTNFLELDPTYRDRSGLGAPVIRITYDMRKNESKLADWMEGKSEEILRLMGAQKTWRGPRFTGVGSSHDLGGCRMGNDPVCSVVDRNLRVHDTPGLYVFSGATFPSCPGINPTLTMWAVCMHAAERLVDDLKNGRSN